MPTADATTATSRSLMLSSSRTPSPGRNVNGWDTGGGGAEVEASADEREAADLVVRPRREALSGWRSLRFDLARRAVDACGDVHIALVEPVDPIGVVRDCGDGAHPRDFGRCVGLFVERLEEPQVGGSRSLERVVDAR